MHLKQLKLTNFKNYESIDIKLSTNINCFVGFNGMGKTNLLDAIYYLCLCKSHFNQPDRLIIRHDQDFFRIDGIFYREERKEHIVCKYDRKKKVIERNKAPYDKFSEHIGMLPAVMITPDDTSLITEGSENRRRFLDVLLVQTDTQYLNKLLEYNKILHQRNAFLKQFKHPSEVNLTLLNVYNKQLLLPAQYIYEKRKECVNALTPVFIEYYELISGNQEKVLITFHSQLLENSLEELFKKSEEKDCWLQRTTKGVHKDDLKLEINEFPVKKYASQGQLKSFLLAMKLAQYELIRREKKVPPILLLDDIFDKLDLKRVNQLLQLLIENGFGQIFITDTHIGRVSSIIQQQDFPFKEFEINNGSVVL